MTRNIAFEPALFGERRRVTVASEVTVPCRNALVGARLTRARARATLFIIAAIALVHGSAVFGQQPASPPASYRPPVIVLAEPLAGVSIPADKPVIVVRFTAGEPDDAIDPASLRLSVDGEDRTSLLQVGSGEAWGPLARDTTTANVKPTSTSSGGVPLIAAGVHLVHVRVCSMRGVCSTLDTTVTVAPLETAAPLLSRTAAADSVTQQHSGHSPLRKVLDLVIAGARKLLVP